MRFLLSNKEVREQENKGTSFYLFPYQLVSLLTCFLTIITTILMIGLLSGCAPEPKGDWVNILSEEEWYQAHNKSEKSYIGVIYDKGKEQWRQTKEEYNRYFLELWYTRYNIHSPLDSGIDLQRFVGKKVEIVGKEKEIIYGKRKAKKILIGKIRLLSSS